MIKLFSQNRQLNNLTYLYYLKAYKPKWFKSILNIIGVNSLRLGGLHSSYSFYTVLESVKFFRAIVQNIFKYFIKWNRIWRWNLFIWEPLWRKELFIYLYENKNSIWVFLLKKCWPFALAFCTLNMDISLSHLREIPHN